MMKSFKQGFTLAEVLTTLMVIGVVAAMTIPTLLNATDDQQKRVAFKKSMSVLSQGIQLMTAKEEECIVTNNHQLAVCMQKVIAGTLYKVKDSDTLEVGTISAASTSSPNQGDQGAGNVIVSNDGLSYAFYYKAADTSDANGQAAEKYKRSLDAICGTSEKMFTNTGTDVAKYWTGENSKCIVVVDMNGPSKGTHSFPKGDSDTNVAGSDLSSSSNFSFGSDQLPLLLTGGGVRPLYKSGTSDAVTQFNKGYTWVYGEQPPFTSSST